jgi:signal transduction histidine kinase
VEAVYERVLVLAPMGQDASLTVTFLNKAGLQAIACGDITELTAKVQEGAGSVVVAEESLDSVAVKLFTDYLEQQPSWSELPITIITSGADVVTKSMQRLTLLGPRANITLIERPFRAITLINTVMAALRSRRRQYQVRDLLAERDTMMASLERRVAERTAQLSETNEQLEAFVYTIAHDLRAPLRAMQAYSSLLLSEYAPALDATAQNYAQRVLRAAERMDKLVIDLLAYGRTARMELSLGSIETASAWTTALTQNEEAITRKKARIETIAPLPKVVAHDVTLSQVLANLLSNALKFSRPGEAPSIRFYAQVNGTVTRLWVEDNGIGIAPEHHERIFRIFERLNGPAYTGTGIGLSIVRKGVERMNGRVGLLSAPGEGTRFWIELPKA